MILKSFFATKVHGDLNFSFDINEDVSFLVGSNGTGKTTALNLINSLLAPDLENLMLLSFNEAVLVIEHESKTISIAARVNNDMVRLSVSGIDKPLYFPSYAEFDYEFISNENEIHKAMIVDVINEYSKTDVVKFLAQIPTPIYLGIDRKVGYDTNSLNYYSERKNGLRKTITLEQVEQID